MHILTSKITWFISQNLSFVIFFNYWLQTIHLQLITLIVYLFQSDIFCLVYFPEIFTTGHSQANVQQNLLCCDNRNTCYLTRLSTYTVNICRINILQWFPVQHTEPRFFFFLPQRLKTRLFCLGLIQTSSAKNRLHRIRRPSYKYFPKTAYCCTFSTMRQGNVV